MTTALFIGGTSGIGLAAARLAVDAGWEVTIASRNPARADIAARKLQTDITDEGAVDALVEAVGSVDHLVSTSVALASGPLRDVDLEAARAAFEAKFWGPLAVVRAADVRRSIVLTSGVAASTPSPGNGISAATNGAIEALVRSLAVELAPVRVNAVAPGIIDTPIFSGLPGERKQAMFERLAGTLPAGRVGRPEDVANGIWHLLNNEFVTGTVLHVDGGHRLAAP